MVTESGADVHHGAPRCLLGLFDEAATGLADWSEFDAEAERWGIEVRGFSREDLRALSKNSTRQIPTTEHRTLHLEASDFVWRGRRGALEPWPSTAGRPSRCSQAWAQRICGPAPKDAQRRAEDGLSSPEAGHREASGRRRQGPERDVPLAMWGDRHQEARPLRARRPCCGSLPRRRRTCEAVASAPSTSAHKTRLPKSARPTAAACPIPRPRRPRARSCRRACKAG
jgi:hypothetical protein